MKLVQKILLIPIVCFWFGGCSFFAISSEENQIHGKNIAVESTKNIAVDDVEIPTGNEIHILFSKIAPLKAKMVVSNKSGKPVYLSYIKGKTDTAEFAFYQLEKRKKSFPVEYEKIPLQSHIVVGTYPLEPGESFNYEIEVPNSGEYRVSISYMIDKLLNEQANSLLIANNNEETLKIHQVLEKKWDRGLRTVVSNSAKLNR